MSSGALAGAPYDSRDTFSRHVGWWSLFVLRVSDLQRRCPDTVYQLCCCVRVHNTRTSPAGRGGRRRHRKPSEERWRDPERSLAAARPEAIPCRVIVSNGVARGNDRTLSYRFKVAADVDSVAPSYLRRDFGVCRVLRHDASTPKSTAQCGMESKTR